MFGNVNKIFLKSLLLLFVHSEGVKENFKASIHIYVYVAVKGVVFFYGIEYLHIKWDKIR